jgi:LL-diaminopimelate aminotransferase
MNVTLPRRLQALPPYLFIEIDNKKRAALARGVDLIDLGVGDPDLPTPPLILDALQAASRDPRNHQYPLGRGRNDFREAASRWCERRFGVRFDPQQELLTLIGTKEGIGHAPLAFVNPGEVVLVPEPGYPVYFSGTVFAGAEPVFLPLTHERGFRPDLEQLPADTVKRAKLLFLNYPNNPTAATVDLAWLRDVVAWCRRHEVILAYDMAYSEVYYDQTPPPSVFQIPEAREVAIEFHSFSKTFSMAGWRLGFACGRRELIDALAQIKGNLDSGTVSAVQIAGRTALDQAEAIVPPLVAVYRERRDLFIAGLRKAGFSVEAPAATFYVWCPVPAGFTSASFASRLLDEAGVVATPGVGFGPSGEGFIRFSLTSPAERLQEAVRRIQAVS